MCKLVNLKLFFWGGGRTQQAKLKYAWEENYTNHDCEIK